jgi:hypothetical protein
MVEPWGSAEALQLGALRQKGPLQAPDETSTRRPATSSMTEWRLAQPEPQD